MKYCQELVTSILFIQEFFLKFQLNPFVPFSALIVQPKTNAIQLVDMSTRLPVRNGNIANKDEFDELEIFFHTGTEILRKMLTLESRCISVVFVLFEQLSHIVDH